MNDTKTPQNAKNKFQESGFGKSLEGEQSWPPKMWKGKSVIIKYSDGTNSPYMFDVDITKPESAPSPTKIDIIKKIVS